MKAFRTNSALAFFASIGLSLLMGSCEKEEVGPQYANEGDGGAVISGEQAIYVVNEGNFQSGNASLTRIVPSKGKRTARIFQKWTGRSLGDVAQSMSRFDGKLFVVVNNSGKIEVLDAGPERQSLGTIDGMSSPRYFLGLTPQKAYVTDLYADAVHIVDPSSLELKGSIPFDGWSEAILEKDGRVFVSNMDQGRLEWIDPAKDEVVDSLKLAEQPNSMVLDANGKLWVLCDGGFEAEKPALYRIDPGGPSIEKEFRFPDIATSPGELTLSPDKEELYFLLDGVRRMRIDAGQLPQQSLVEEGNGQFYALDVSASPERIHITDAKDYVQNGALYRFHRDGTPLDTFETGIIPNEVHFELE